MIKFNLETTEKVAIQGYQAGEINIALSGIQYSGDQEHSTDNTKTKSIQCMKTSFILTPNSIIEDWPYREVSELNSDSFEALIALKPELVILGTGEKLRFPDHQALQSFHQANIGVEVMNNASACRTFNVLVAENRYVIAGFLML